jgi:hypothetical protein
VGSAVPDAARALEAWSKHFRQLAVAWVSLSQGASWALAKDIRFALRISWKNAGHAAVCILTRALAIGPAWIVSEAGR